MILYSVEPLDRIFPTREHEREFLEFEGGTLEGYRENGHFTVTSLISTDPGLFLDEKFSPGATLTYGKDGRAPDPRRRSGSEFLFGAEGGFLYF